MARKGPGTDGPLQTALLESTSATTTRASEGQKIFSPIAAFLDKHRSQTTGLAPHLLRALTALSDDLALVAQQHFNAYISGISMIFILPALSPSTSSSLTPNPLSPLPPPLRPPSGLEQSTYTTITQYAPVKSTPTTHSKASTGFALCTPLNAGYAASQSILKRAMLTAAQPWSLINVLPDTYTAINYIQLIP
ncbi:conserved hypothetical protein [Talaromyces stipitatus ATCC 10500]|uniref:Uncharacterized protein n=1 Tax=Talaromyces stipitatus (strain ATCC 10500 / CBS 375.48 / QM 6759 / NRRL 1006) TaxID=441959 RepID=B8LX27_TALSN|nr:uncharacterized protein TSTA_061650 [Talaromyces stipitatus ATCC 10500]EED22677.1 conserved hypothetical protein [Talaromyces stipitatus ATCC 10500]